MKFVNKSDQGAFHGIARFLAPTAVEGQEEPSKGDTCLAGKVGLPPSDGYQASGLDR